MVATSKEHQPATMMLPTVLPLRLNACHTAAGAQRVPEYTNRMSMVGVCKFTNICCSIQIGPPARDHLPPGAAASTA